MTLVSRIETRKLAVAVVLITVVVGCIKRPLINTDLIHPDSDKQITFSATRGEVTGTISQMEINVEGTVGATCPGDNCSYTGGPYVAYSNSRLDFFANAIKASGSNATKSGWVYIANPKNVFTFALPNGSDNGYPSQTSEQTGANLYRLDKTVVRNRAQDALAEYVNWLNTDGDPSNDIDILTASNVADHMVASVAYYVDAHMTWRSDANNITVFADNGFGSYSPGWDFPQPADLTLTISGNLTNANESDDFQGDCEDYAILRAALLRALGFAPWAIWDAIDNPISHEYNLVLYEGAFRLMDYGRITRWLNTHTWDAHRSYYGWNEDHGPRGVSSTNHDYLVNHVDNYPGGKSDGNPWSYLVYYKDTSP